MNNKAEFTVSEVLGLILGGAVAIALIFMALAALGTFDKSEQTAKSMTRTLQTQIDRAEEGKTGLFQIPLQLTDKTDLYVIYFNGRYAMTVDGKTFFNTDPDLNQLSVCYSDTKSRECYTIPTQKTITHLTKEGFVTEAWYFKEGEQISVEQQGEKLQFKKL